ncbi:MAG: leucine-rich repeat protein [Bacteroidales bacterium]|nr:leucine-rich repeat protein [Bacteroidales bacterium]
MKNKNNKKTNLLTRILHDKKGIYVTTAMKIVIALVTGITVLTGSTYVVKDVVMPQTESKIVEEFDKDYSAEGSGSGGAGGSITGTRNGTIPEGCIYTLADGTILSAGTEIPPTPLTGDVYEEGDYKYIYNRDYDYDDVMCDYVDFGTEWSVVVTDTSKDLYGAIQSEIAGKPVTHLTYTFRFCEHLTSSPAIPCTVTSMEGTFLYCSSLLSAPYLPSNLTNMHSTFEECTSLKTYVGSADPDGDLSNYSLPNSVTYFNAAFRCCSSLTAAPNIPYSVIDMVSSFYGCSMLLDAPAIPDGVIDMSFAFADCSSLASAPVIPSGVASIAHTFGYCASLTSAPLIPNSVVDMTGTFESCGALTTAPIIPSNVEIMNDTFNFCTSLSGSLEVNAEPYSYENCLNSTQITSITGSCSQETKDALLATK